MPITARRGFLLPSQARGPFRYLPPMPIALSPEKLAAGKAFIDGLGLRPGMRVCLTTHVNPDGDGLG